MMTFPKSLAHIRTSKHVKSFRSCPTATGESMAHLDKGRIVREEDRLAKRQERRRRLAGEGSSRQASLEAPRGKGEG